MLSILCILGIHADLHDFLRSRAETSALFALCFRTGVLFFAKDLLSPEFQEGSAWKDDADQGELPQ